MHYNWDKMTDTQKIQAIDKELSFETHMGVTKDDLMNMIRYMRGQFEVIDAQPTILERTAEFRNVHLSYDGDDDDTWECSECKQAWIIDGNPKKHHYHYCPNCGARFKEAK